MHQAAESGEAAHTFYKGGLLAGQAARLSAWAQALQPAPRLPDALPAHASGSEGALASEGRGFPDARLVPERDAAAVELFRCACTPFSPPPLQSVGCRVGPYICMAGCMPCLLLHRKHFGGLAPREANGRERRNQTAVESSESAKYSCAAYTDVGAGSGHATHALLGALIGRR